jgi:hypothetical protein
MAEQPDRGSSDFYGSAGPATPRGGGAAWPPPPLWRPVMPSSHARMPAPGAPADDPFPVPGGQATAPPLGRRRRRSGKHLVGYPLTALAALAVGMMPGGSGSQAEASETRDLAAPVSQPAHTVTVTVAPTGGTGSKAASPRQTTTKRRLTAGPTTAPAERGAAASPAAEVEGEGVLAAADAAYEDCAAARAAGAAPLKVGDPGYRSALDKDKDGTACE